MTIGIEQFRHASELRIDRMLTQPFRNDRRRAAADPTAEVRTAAAAATTAAAVKKASA
jgi:hypothetical protein